MSGDTLGAAIVIAFFATIVIVLIFFVLPAHLRDKKLRKTRNEKHGKQR